MCVCSDPEFVSRLVLFFRLFHLMNVPPDLNLWSSKLKGLCFLQKNNSRNKSLDVKRKKKKKKNNHTVRVITHDLLSTRDNHSIQFYTISNQE